jgi:hypothetical protein
MRKFLTAAAAAATIMTATSFGANALPAAPAPEGASQVTRVALCFYADGWNGAGMYECGYRHRRGHGWHGPRHEKHRYHHDRDRR